MPPIVRVGVLVALYDVPVDSYRIGNTRIFFRVGHISRVRQILDEPLPLSIEVPTASHG